MIDAIPISEIVELIERQDHRLKELWEHRIHNYPCETMNETGAFIEGYAFAQRNLEELKALLPGTR